MTNVKVCPTCEGYGVVEVKGKHTDEQRGFYWAHLHKWGKELGYSVKETEIVLHNAVLCDAYGIDHYINFKGVAWPVPKERSHDQDVEQYMVLINSLERMMEEAE